MRVVMGVISLYFFENERKHSMGSWMGLNLCIFVFNLFFERALCPRWKVVVF
jgi:hypothetical protein